MLKISRITDSDDVSGFSCESVELEAYLKKYALRNDKMRISTCMLARDQESLAGYYTTHNQSCLKEEFVVKDIRGLPGYPVPCIELGKLAVDKRMARKGYGKAMLKDLFTRIARETQNPHRIGAFRFLIVDTSEGSPGAEEFYKKYGFKNFPDDKNRLYLSVKTILKACS